MPWFKKAKRAKPVRADRRRGAGGEGGIPEGLWLKCDGCRDILYSRDLDAHLRVCPGCGHHFRIDAGERITRAAELALATGRPLVVGFAGPRVIEQTIRRSLPEGFQRSEFLLDHGFLDMVVPRGELKPTLATCLRHLGG